MNIFTKTIWQKKREGPGAIYLLLLCMIWLSACKSIANTAGRIISDPEMVIFYPTYGYLEEDEWVILMRTYVFEYRNVLEEVAESIGTVGRELTEEETERFHYRIKDFVVDSESREIPAFRFVDDPLQEVFQIVNSDGDPLRTDLNGLISAEFRLPVATADRITQGSAAGGGWLQIRSANEDHEGGGWIRLLKPEGVSVISDIDDTIKITDIPAGRSVVLENTFFKPFQAVPGMAERYQEYGPEVAFHYVSGSPWQLYRPLSEFLWSDEVNFPLGSFHMKTVTKNLLSLSTWSSLGDLLFNEDFTYEQKKEQIEGILKTFPDRKFILYGDSGESDPEIFSELNQMYGDQIVKMVIRDVRGVQQEDPGRLEGMEVIPVN